MVRKILENIGRDGVQLSTVEEGLKRGKEYLSHCITRERKGWILLLQDFVGLMMGN